MTKFIAALDQSGGSTPGALDRYGVEYNEFNMMDKIHEMRLRIVRSPTFNCNNIRGAILFKESFERGLHTIIHNRGIPTYLKIDNGLEEDGTMKPINVQENVKLAQEYGAWGTKMHSVIHDKASVKKILKQQFIVASKVPYPLTPIIEPEISIHNPDKAEIEGFLAYDLYDYLDNYDGKCILKLTPPDEPNQYYNFTKHPKVSSVVFLSGGYDMQRACNILGLNDDVKASFSRALTENLKHSLTDEEFNDIMEHNINMIANASQ